jgi:Trypsin-like peptidase domain
MDAYSRTVARIELFSSREISEKSSCGHATGFLFRHNNELFLITNWHVVTGTDPTNLAPVVCGPRPEALTLEYKQSVGANGVPTVGAATITNVLSPLYLYQRSTPVWFEHITRQNVDVVALSLATVNPDAFFNLPVNEVDQDRGFDVTLGMDCFVLGYPQGMLGPGSTPIWKRGSIASEPMYDYRGKLGFLIDTATREGMSGAPVIARHSGVVKQGPVSVIGTATKFIGIYSGRIGTDPIEVQLGMVWRKEVLNDILSKETTGFNPWR